MVCVCCLQEAAEEDDTMTVEDKLTADVQRLAASIKVGGQLPREQTRCTMSHCLAGKAAVQQALHRVSSAGAVAALRGNPSRSVASTNLFRL